MISDSAVRRLSNKPFPLGCDKWNVQISIFINNLFSQRDVVNFILEEAVNFSSLSCHNSFRSAYLYVTLRQEKQTSEKKKKKTHDCVNNTKRSTRQRGF